MPALNSWTSAGFTALLSAAVGCSGPCEDPYPEGTRFKVTVLDAFEDCHVTFAAGHTYDVIAGPAGDVDTPEGTCPVNRGVEIPGFTSADYEFERCTFPGLGRSTCDASVDGCPGRIVMWHRDFPDERGKAAETELRLSYTSALECGQSCAAIIPVSIRW